MAERDQTSSQRVSTSSLVVGALTLLATLLRLDGMRQDLFADELATYWIVRDAGLVDVVRSVTSDAEITPPFAFVAAWFSMLLGDSPALIRLPALIAGIGSIPLSYALAARSVGRRAGLVAAAVIALSPFMTYYGAEGRGYGLLMGLVLVSTYSLLRGTEEGGRWWWLYGIAITLAMYTHYTGTFVLAAQAGWAFLARPQARRALVTATGLAAAAFVPWLPSLAADFDSPTTRVLEILSPTDPESMRSSLWHWSFGFPNPTIGLPLPYDIAGTSLSDFPGLLSFVCLVAAAALGVVALATPRPPARSGGDGGPERRSGGGTLIVLLAVASPVGAAAQSLIGTDVFRTRSFAPSWPFLAIGLAALVSLGRGLPRQLATGLLLASFVLAAAVMQRPEFERPDYEPVLDLARERSAGVVVNAATLSPGPLTNFEVSTTTADVAVLRLTVPEQMEDPFWFGQPQPDPVDIARRAVAAAGDRPVLLVAFVPPQPAVDDFLAALPDGYELTYTEEIEGIFRMEARVYENAG